MKTARMITLFEDRTTLVRLTDFERDELLSLEPLWGRQNFVVRSDNRLLLKKYVGFVATPNLQIQILPKIYHDEYGSSLENQEIDESVRVLFRLMAFSNFISVKEIPEPQEISAIGHDLLEVFIHLFVKRFMDLFSRHVHRLYENQEETTVLIKGKILFQKTVLLSGGLRHRHVVEYDEFTEDNLLNRILKTVMKRMRELTKSAENKRKLTIGINALGNVGSIQLSNVTFERVRFNRLNEMYRPLFDMARMFYRNQQPGLRAGDEYTFSFLVPLNELFEYTVYKLMERGYERTHFKLGYQGPRKYLDSSQSTFLLKPDITVTGRTGVEMIVDAKYKEPFVDSLVKLSQSDVYQMLAYAVRYRCSSVSLIYPKFKCNGQESNLLAVQHIDIDGRLLELSAIQLDICHDNLDFIGNDLMRSLTSNRQPDNSKSS